MRGKSETPLVGKKHIDIAHGMPRSRRNDIHWIIVEIDRQPLRQRLAARKQAAARHGRSCPLEPALRAAAP